jgi:hypothetical protein
VAWIIGAFILFVVAGLFLVIVIVVGRVKLRREEVCNSHSRLVV